MTQLDPRVYAFREDLAAAYLQDRVRAPRYSEGELRQVVAPVISLRTQPKFDAEQSTQALCGELLTVYDIKDGWAWVQLKSDGYVGYTTTDGLSTQLEENSHKISARLTYLYSAADIKTQPITRLSFAAMVGLIARPEGRFAELSRGGFVFVDHLVGVRERAKDFVRVAERFVGVPYLWGGKTSLGIDCSGLVQISLQSAGIACPRDSDMQAEMVGEAVKVKNLDSIQRGDLMFWRGHVAIAQSADWMIHANAHHMEVTVEPIRRAVDRIAEKYGPMLVVKRVAQEAALQPVPLAESSKASQPQAEGPQLTAQSEDETRSKMAETVAEFEKSK